MVTPSLDKVSAQREAYYGTPEPFPLTDPFELVAWEEVAYLVDDERREEVYKKLRQDIGLDPVTILNCPRSLLAQTILRGGMQPERRAEKLQTSAQIILEVGAENLRTMLANAPAK